MKNSCPFRCIQTGNRVRKHRSTSGSLCWCRFTRFSSPSRRHSCHTASSRKHTCSKDHDSFLGDGPVLSLSNLAGLALTFTRVFASRVTLSGGLSLSWRAWKVWKSTTSSLRIYFLFPVGHVVMVLLQADKNDVHLLPKLLDEKVWVSSWYAHRLSSGTRRLYCCQG